ncbi:L-idonate 5-dehydrogenase [Aureimonas leprariae]|uniref:L-idonate 5-dehydrogenase n=1 Tax=Plantimonas leprariae TaxID=2615207 RepID=A0A7V7TV64_9HYPH|nr:L-idonate 5-dehydrogenase [Aureimonas leprariae]KAB0677240.1 L-idonate 5-dehydrogenase [Aureimonas leprariae]
MKAVVIHAPGDLRIDEVGEEPVGTGEVRVRIAAGGICGSDLHYFRHGGFGAVRLKAPMILGHEIAGVVAECGAGVAALRVGQTVAVNPSLPCEACEYCRKGLQNHCLDMRFLGSAMRWPHVQGGFRETLVCRETQAVPVPDGVSPAEAAFAEPLAVALHAMSRAGPLVGRRVLVTGSGPIGVLVAAAARRAGAGEIVVTDVLDAPLAFAARVGADRTLDVAAEPDALAAFAAGKGTFDIMFEASGSGAAIVPGLAALKPRGVLVLVGQGGEAALPVSLVVTKEIELRGAFRFHEEFATAVSFIARRLVDVAPLLTGTVGVADARQAFELAGDKRRAMKVQLGF